MSLLIPPQPPAVAEVRCAEQWQTQSIVEGPEGRWIEELIQQHVSDLKARHTVLASMPSTDQFDLNEDSELDYGPVPPRRTFHVPTLYVYRGRGKPAPFDYDID